MSLPAPSTVTTMSSANASSVALPTAVTAPTSPLCQPLGSSDSPSTCAVVARVVSWLVTATPAVYVSGRVRDTGGPTAVHVVPSVEMAPATLFDPFAPDDHDS